MSEHDQSRREFIKKAIYTTPIILTLPAMLSFASAGTPGGGGEGPGPGPGFAGGGGGGGGGCQWWEWWCWIPKMF